MRANDLEESRKDLLEYIKEKIVTAGSYIEDESYEWASRELLDVYKRTDGLPDPMDFVKGDATFTLA
ncbi:MAG: hypothetical protein GTN53_22150, partial [Candidatus Aminicenantes bacterium]|nr:hypothetical protein [Candidatus Aminicenantes bacterium]NIQ69205.1 hypothetical protein [Candidatus Aminicenantes bacterium]NIT25208.1 hypothetical protein [Candidatus Aminicenantes bacterium]